MSNNIVIREPKKRFKRFLYNLLDIVTFLVFIFWVFMFVKVFIISPVVVKWHSMLPNYKPNDYIFIDKFYRKLTGWLKRWDVVVVMPSAANRSFLKRIIWLPGETIEIRSGSVFLCKKLSEWDKYEWDDIIFDSSYKSWKLICRELKEPYIRWKTVNVYGFEEKIITTPKCNISRFTLWSGEYLVFGDDRMYSTDSRCCFKWFCLWTWDTYYVTEDEILWRVWNFKISLFK